MNLRSLLPLLCAALLLPAVARAATLNVPAQYPTIQAGVNAAVNGDTVLVADGTYSGPGNRDIDFNGKNITVTSQHGAASTIIDCGGTASSDGSGNHRGFYIHSGETAAAISGFTIQNGYEQYVSGVTDSGFGGGICNNNGRSSGTITLTGCTLSKMWLSKVGVSMTSTTMVPSRSPTARSQGMPRNMAVASITITQVKAVARSRLLTALLPETLRSTVAEA